MAEIIRLIDGVPQAAADDWAVLDAKEAPAAADFKRRLLPLAFALEHAAELRAHQPTGIWLEPQDEPAQAAPLFDRIALVAVSFPKFTDGRGYSTASLLRGRYGWRGELRAIGDVLQDQLFYLRRVGFDSFALRADRSIHEALRAFKDFSVTYQGAADDTRPLFARTGAPA